MLNKRRNAPQSRSPLAIEIEIWDGEQCRKSLHNNSVIRQGYVNQCIVERSLPTPHTIQMRNVALYSILVEYVARFSGVRSPSELAAMKRGQDALTAQSKARCSRSRNGSHRCMQARPPHSQALQRRAPFQHARMYSDHQDLIPGASTAPMTMMSLPKPHHLISCVTVC